MKLKRIYKTKEISWLLGTLIYSHKIICHGSPETGAFQKACFQFDNVIVEFLSREGWVIDKIVSYCQDHEVNLSNITKD